MWYEVTPTGPHRTEVYTPSKTSGEAELWHRLSRLMVLIIAWNDTLPETNIAPKNGWLESYFPIGEAYFQGLC